jgi:hypothetical protein
MPEQLAQPPVNHLHPEDTAPLLPHPSPHHSLHQYQVIGYNTMVTDEVQAQNWLGRDDEGSINSREQIPPGSQPHPEVDDLSSVSIHQILHNDTGQPHSVDLTNGRGAIDTNAFSSSESYYRNTETPLNATSFFDVGNLVSAPPTGVLNLAQIDSCLPGFSLGEQLAITQDLQFWFEQFDNRTHVISENVPTPRNGTPVPETTSPLPRTRNSPLHTRADSIRSVDSAVPAERFQKVEQCWPHRSGNKIRAMHDLWRELSLETVDNLFTDPGDLARPVSLKHIGSSRRGLDQEARDRLEKILHRVRQIPNSGAVAPVTTIDLPPAQIFDMGLDLYFRHFHPLLPFIHIPTFDPRSTDVSVLFIMCIIGITLISTNGAVSFVQQAFGVSSTSISMLIW